MDKATLEQYRAYLEQTDPWRGEWTRERTEHDIRMGWDLLLEVERLREEVDFYRRRAIDAQRRMETLETDRL